MAVPELVALKRRCPVTADISLDTSVVMNVELWVSHSAVHAFSFQSEDFPELEILWLLTRAWNTGILLYSLAQYPEAEKWCSLGMSFLCHLGSLQESYQTQVQYWGA